MVVFQHIVTRTNGPESYMTGLGDVIAREVDGGTAVYTASGMGGGVLVRSTGTDLNTQDSEAYSLGLGLAAARQLSITEIEGTPVLLAPGRYGDQIEAWAIESDGTLGASNTLIMEGGELAAVLAMVDVSLPGGHVFVTANRYSSGLEVWMRDGDALRITNGSDTADFLQSGTVQGLALVDPGTGPVVLAINITDDALVSFPLLADGALGLPQRLDNRDGLFIDAPTALETVELGGQTYAIIGAAGSSSISVVAIGPNGQMNVTSQVNDTQDTRFNDLVALDALEAGGTVFVLAAGSDNGISLLTLQPGGTLTHMASLGDELREMALVGPGGLDMVWRDGGLDIFVTGQVAPGTSDAGYGVTQLRIDDVVDDLPVLHLADATLVQHGTDGVDVFVLADTDDRQEVRGFDPGVDRLDLTNFGRVYDVGDLSITSKNDGAEIKFEGTVIRIFSDDRSSLVESDFTETNIQDLWQIDVSADVSVPLSVSGSAGADLLDGRDGNDMLLGQPVDAGFDPYAAQVFRLYQATLGRSPDVNGLMNWTGRLADGERSLVEVTSGFTNSAEFIQTYGTTDNAAFVTLLYDNVLGRAPDAQGLENWSGRLSRGEMSREEVVVGFSESAEFKTTTQAEVLGFSHAGLQANFGDDVYRLYQATLDRAPDLNGFLNWTGRLADSMSFLTVVNGFTNSAEFVQTYGATDNAAFVTLLYDNVLDRAPDVQGLENWSGRLSRGEMSRAEVVLGFSQSVEFRANTMDDLKAWNQSVGKDDVLDGGGGNNVLMGGILSDTFVFRAVDNGQHVVVDAEPWDVLRLEGFGYENVEDVADHLRAEGGNVIFNDDDVRIEFLNTTLSQILDIDFEL